MEEKIVVITNHGMICIPAPLRKKYALKDGSKVIISDDEMGQITIIPLETMESIREQSYSLEELKDELKKSRKEEKGLEE